MNAPAHIKVIAENVTNEARALAPGEGRRRPAEVDAAGVRAWLEHFAALPAFDTEEADARLYLEAPAHRLMVRRAGGRLGTDEGGTFVAATIDEIVAQLLAAPRLATPVAAEAEAPLDLAPAARARVRAQAWLLAGLLTGFAAACWWTTRPETPDGMTWIGDTGECRAILAKAAGRYASNDEQLMLDAGAQLTVTSAEGEETLRTTVRVGRRAGAAVLVTAGGVVLEVTADGRLRIDAIDYRRVPAGG